MKENKERNLHHKDAGLKVYMEITVITEELGKITDKSAQLNREKYIIFTDKDVDDNNKNPYISIYCDKVMLDINKKNNNDTFDNVKGFYSQISELKKSEYLENINDFGYERPGKNISNKNNINEYIKYINLLTPYYLYLNKSYKDGKLKKSISKNRANALIIRNEKLVSLFEKKYINVENKLYNLLALEKIEDEIKVL